MTTWLLTDALVASILMAAGVVTAVCLRGRSAAERHWVLALTEACALARAADPQRRTDDDPGPNPDAAACS